METRATLCISRGIEEHFKDVSPLQPMAEYFKAHRPELVQRVTDFDNTINSMNHLLIMPSLAKDFPHLLKLKSSLGENRLLPNLSTLAETQEQPTTRYLIGKAWLNIRKKVRDGDLRPDEVGDPARFGSLLLVVGYANLLSIRSDNQDLEDNFVHAFDEYLRTHKSESILRKDFFPHLDEAEEGVDIQAYTPGVIGLLSKPTEAQPQLEAAKPKISPEIQKAISTVFPPEIKPKSSINEALEKIVYAAFAQDPNIYSLNPKMVERIMDSLGLSYPENYNSFKLAAEANSVLFMVMRLLKKPPKRHQNH